MRNYPLVKPTREDGTESVIDLATVELFRDRERGVPRYNAFRQMLNLYRINSFEELTPDRELAKQIQQIYDDKLDDVDLMVGLFAEEPPKGFGFSDTAFRIFVLIASRRLNSDRFFTTDFMPAVYSPVGMQWIHDT
jgi:Animal haem peroxidase